MTEPIIFVVERGAGGSETPAVYIDRLPVRLTRKITRLPDGTPAEPNPIIYALRLDKLPDAERWLGLPLDRLYRAYLALRDQGKLPPPNLTDPPRPAASRGNRLLGEQWEPPARTWADRPADVLPAPGNLQPKPDAPGYIGPAQVAEAMGAVPRSSAGGVAGKRLTYIA